MVAHQRLGLLPKLVRHKDTPFVILLILQFENEIETRDFFPNFPVVTPSNFIDILILNISVDKALSQLSLAAREIPLAETDGLSCSRVFELVNRILRHLNIQQWVKSFNRQESAVARVALDMSAVALLERLFKFPCFISLSSNSAHYFALQEVRRSLLKDGTGWSILAIFIDIT